MPLTAPVRQGADVKAVYCPSCSRYLGAYLGKAQCPSCKRWVTVLDSRRVSD